MNSIGPMSPISPTPSTGVPPVDLSFARLQDELRRRESFRHTEFLRWMDSDDGERGLILAMLTHDKMRDAVLAVLSNYATCTDHNGDEVDSSDVLIAITDAMDDVFEDQTGREYLAESNRVKSVKVVP